MMIQQIIEHHVKLLGLKMIELYGTGRTFGSAYATTHAFRCGNLALVINIRKRRIVGADVDTGHAGNALILVNL
jgi:hypothetical protein